MGRIYLPKNFCTTGDADQISEIEISFEIEIDLKAV